MNVATWNVRALLDRDKSSNAERRTAIVTRQLARYNVDIAAPSETHQSEVDQLSERGAGHTFFWRSKAEGEKREEGRGWALPFGQKSSSSWRTLTELMTGLCV